MTTMEYDINRYSLNKIPLINTHEKVSVGKQIIITVRAKSELYYDFDKTTLIEYFISYKILHVLRNEQILVLLSVSQTSILNGHMI